MDVSGDVELRVVDPDRIAQPERDLYQLLAIARRAAHASVDVVAELGEAGRSAVRRRIERGRPADVHVRSRALDLQKRRVERG